MKNASLGVRLIVSTLVLLVVVAAIVWGVLRGVKALGEPIPTAMLVPVAVLVAVLVTGMKRVNVINHHDPRRIELPPHPVAHLAPWALVASAGVAWALRRFTPWLPYAQLHNLAIAVVGLVVFGGVLASEWFLVRQRVDYEPAWHD